MSKDIDKIIEDCRANNEPIFLLRAKDKFSVVAIRAYLRKLSETENKIEPSFYDEIESFLCEFEEWQRSNISNVKIPD